MRKHLRAVLSVVIVLEICLLMMRMTRVPQEIQVPEESSQTTNFHVFSDSPMDLLLSRQKSSLPSLKRQHLATAAPHLSDSKVEVIPKVKLRQETANVTFPPPFKLPDPNLCRPRKNVYFLKTHKCGSTTVQNIFLRYGYKNDLTIVFGVNPRTLKPERVPTSYIGSQLLFQARYVQSHPSKEYNILCLHHRFNLQPIKKLMPKDTKFISILRDPAAQFESVYKYYQLDTTYQVSLKDFLLDPQHYIEEQILSHRKNYFARNPMLYDAGLDLEDSDKELLVKEKIAEIDENFDLVIVDQYYDEGLILLKELMCWTYDDVISFKQNARKPKDKDELTDDTREKILKWNWGDKLLYDHFHRKMNKTIEAYGVARMKEETEKLRHIRRHWFFKCVDYRAPSEHIFSKLFKPYGKATGFILREDAFDDDRCMALAAAELGFLKAIRKAQYGF